jgi:hypothetical protein
MFKSTSLLKKIALVTLVIALGLAILPAAGASAAGIKEVANLPVNKTVDNSRLEQAWARLQQTYQKQGARLAAAEGIITKGQTLIDKATQKGYDTSAVQAALNAFSAALPGAQAAHDNGAAIIASHAGFDENGKVTDRTTAIATTKSLHQVLADTRAAMGGTGKALREAIKAFREANKPAQAPATTTP